MNKTIYEEAKRDLISLTAKFVIPNVEETEYGCIYDYCHFYNILDEQEESYLKKVEQALEQAQKQEKLLQLYRRLVNQNLQVNLHILEKIKELENE